MADPFFGYIPMSAIDPERLASVRVQRGGGSGAFGAGAVAGTVDLTSAGANALGLLNAQAMVDDRGETTVSGALAPKLGQGFAVVTGRWDRGQGFWTTPESQRVPASVRARYDSWSTGVRAVAPLTPEVELQARVAAFEDNRTLRFAGADNGISGQDGSLRLVGRGAWQFDALAYVQARDFHAVTVSSTSFKKTLDQYGTLPRASAASWNCARRWAEAMCSSWAQTGAGPMARPRKTRCRPRPAWSPRGAGPAGARMTWASSSRMTGRSARWC
jgi:hypothetical protein